VRIRIAHTHSKCYTHTQSATHTHKVLHTHKVSPVDRATKAEKLKKCRWRPSFWQGISQSDTALIDHLVMREFVSGTRSCRSIHKRVRERKPSLRESSWAVCGSRTEFFEKRQFFGSWFFFKLWVFEEHSPPIEIKHHMHMLRVYGHRRWRRSPRQVSAGYELVGSLLQPISQFTDYKNQLPKNCRFSKNSVLANTFYSGIWMRSPRRCFFRRMRSRLTYWSNASQLGQRAFIRKKERTACPWQSHPAHQYLA